MGGLVLCARVVSCTQIKWIECPSPRCVLAPSVPFKADAACVGAQFLQCDLVRFNFCGHARGAYALRRGHVHSGVELGAGVCVGMCILAWGWARACAWACALRRGHVRGHARGHVHSGVGLGAGVCVGMCILAWSWVHA